MGQSLKKNTQLFVSFIFMSFCIVGCGGRGDDIDLGVLPVQEVSRSGVYLIALREDGSIKVVDTSKGEPQDLNGGSLYPSNELENVVDVFAWHQAFVATHFDGDLTVWGNPNVVSRFDDESDVKRITDSWGYLTFLRYDNSIAYWVLGEKKLIPAVADDIHSSKGPAFLTSSGDLYEYDQDSAEAVLILQGVKDFTIGEDGAADLALKKDGSVVNLGNDKAAEKLIEFTDYDKIVSTGFGGRTHYVLGLRSNGQVVVWGESYDVLPNPFNAELSDFIDVEVADNGCLTGLREGGTVVSWGWCASYRDVSAELSM